MPIHPVTLTIHRRYSYYNFEALRDHFRTTKGKIYAYEVNGFGSFNLTDDANVPSLLSMPYLGTVKTSDPIYQTTRKYVWSEDNPFFFKGTAAEGIGGPHMGLNMIWPLSIIMKGLTSSNETEIRSCLMTLQKNTCGNRFYL